VSKGIDEAGVGVDDLFRQLDTRVVLYQWLRFRTTFCGTAICLRDGTAPICAASGGTEVFGPQDLDATGGGGESGEFSRGNVGVKVSEE
jgi:hypothetical protein